MAEIGISEFTFGCAFLFEQTQAPAGTSDAEEFLNGYAFEAQQFLCSVLADMSRCQQSHHSRTREWHSSLGPSRLPQGPASQPVKGPASVRPRAVLTVKSGW